MNKRVTTQTWLANIVRFSPLLTPLAPRFYNTSARERFPHFSKECFVPHSNQYRISQSAHKGFHTLIKNASFLSPTDVRSHNSPPWRLSFSLAHCLVSGFDTICNSPSPSIVDIVRFGPLRIAVNLTVLKRDC